MTGRKGVITVIEEVDAPCGEAIVTLEIQQRDATTVDKKRERRESGKKCGGYARMCGIKDCPEVDLYFQGTGMNGWLVSAVYHNDEGLIETRNKFFLLYHILLMESLS